MKWNTWLVSTVLACALPLAGHAQSSDQTLDQEVEELVRLSPFEITDNRASPYRATESLGGARIRRDLIDTGASINVITSDFIRDIGASSILDATQYVSGVSYSYLSGLNGLFTRQIIRGFEIFEVTLDGFTNMGGFQPGVDPELMERIETIKGPHSLLVPAGQPGGTSNMVTKSPKFEPGHTIKYELADQHFGNKITVDTTASLPLFGGDKLAYRIIATHHDTHSTVPGRMKNHTFNPMLTWAISPTTQLKLKGYIIDWGRTGAVAANVNNINLRDDLPHGATATVADIKPGYEYGGANGAPEWVNRLSTIGRSTAELTTKFGEHISLKLGAVYQYYHYYDNFGGLWANRPGQSGINTIDPLTGFYTHNQNWQITNPALPWDETTNPYFGTPVDRSVAGAALSETWQQIWIEETTYQADLVGQWDLPFAKLQVVTGASRSRVWDHSKFWVKQNEVLFGQGPTHDGYTPAPLPIPSTLPLGITDLTNFNYVNGVPRPATTGALLREGWNHGNLKTQAYINANLDLVQGKLLLNGGAAHIRQKTRGNRTWSRSNVYTFTPSESTNAGGKSPSKTSPSFSAVYKVTPWASVYGSVAKNAQAGSYYNGNGDINNRQQTWREGKQNEVGVKMEFFNRRLFVTAAWFDLKQTNINVTHPDRNRDPSMPDLSLADLLFDVTNEGIEFDIVGQITPNLNVLASYTDMKLRDHLGRERQGVPDRMYNALLRYGFSSGAAKGLSLSIGVNHVDKQAGENPLGNYTPIGVVIPIGVYQPARTIYNAGATYQYGPLRFQLNVDNLFDKKTLYQFNGRFQATSFPERNIRLTTSYSF